MLTKMDNVILSERYYLAPLLIQTPSSPLLQVLFKELRLKLKQPPEVFVIMSQNSRQNICARISFLKKLHEVPQDFFKRVSYGFTEGFLAAKSLGPNQTSMMTFLQK